MKAAVVPAAHTKWEIREVPIPTPSENQVLIRIRASGLCYTDIRITNGHILTEFPRTLGHEVVGEIAQLGPGVRTRLVGDRVGVAWAQTSCGRCEWCKRDRPMFCSQGVGTGVQMPGGHAEYMLAFADATVLLPDGLPYEQAAPIFCAGYTAWSGLRWADPKPTDRVAVLGVGGLGHLAVQFSVAAGFRTFAISHSSDKDRIVRELGAEEVVREGSDLKRMGGADIILATGNSTVAVENAIEGLRPDGRLVVMGFDTNSRPLSISMRHLISKRIRVIGSQQNHKEFLFEALDFAARGRVKVITESYSLADVGKAYERLERGNVRFRAVIVP